MMRNERGYVLLLTLIFLPILASLIATGLMRSTLEVKSAELSGTLAQATHQADGQIDEAWMQLRKDWFHTKGSGYTVEALDFRTRKITSTATIKGYTRQLEAVIRRDPDSFYDNVLYLTGILTIKGNSHDIIGNVETGTEGGISTNANVSGERRYDATINPLRQFDMTKLRQIAESQGNIYNEFNKGFMPQGFWYNQALGIPNVVIYEGNTLDVGGNVIVGGLIIINSGEPGTFAQNGNVQVNGGLYVNGDADFGGGGHREVNGCVWSGGNVHLNGNIVATYRRDYLEAIEALTTQDGGKLKMWREIQ